MKPAPSNTPGIDPRGREQTGCLAGMGGLLAMPPLGVKTGPPDYRVSLPPLRSGRPRAPAFGWSGLDTEPPAARQGAGAGRHGLPSQTATPNESEPQMNTTTRTRTTAAALADTIWNEFGIEVDPQLVANGDVVAVLNAFHRTGYEAGHEAATD